MDQRKVARSSAEELGRLVWDTPVTQLAARFGVSDKAIDKWCRGYGIDKPPRGYWAKKYAEVAKLAETRLPQK